eukprot:2570561-Amphidinium_carterae.2
MAHLHCCRPPPLPAAAQGVLSIGGPGHSLENLVQVRPLQNERSRHKSLAYIKLQSDLSFTELGGGNAHRNFSVLTLAPYQESRVVIKPT